MLDFLTKFFRREESSKSQAKERLRLVLLSDRVSLAPETFDSMKAEMLSVVQRYLDIDEQGLDVHFETAERHFMLLANIPVVSIKSSEQIELERQRVAVGGHNGVGVGNTVRRRRRRRRHRQVGGSNGHVASEASPQTEADLSPGDSSASGNGAAPNN